MHRHAALTHTGHKRERNEDAYVVDEKLGLFVVADGMGGHEHGDVASRLAVETVQREVGAGASLENAIRTANRRIMDEPGGDSLRSMGTTVCAARVDGGATELAWVGDSRAYRWHGALQALTTDHTFVQELVERGELDEHRARSHPYRSMLTQALGVGPASTLQVDHARPTFDAGDTLLLCSDGLTEELGDERIAEAFEAGGGPQTIADRLLTAALDEGGSDNVTLILVEFTD